MSFTWTYPDPLDPNQPSLIGNHLRNVIPTLAVYIQELCDAIDTLRENIGQTPYNWTIYRPEVGDTLLYEHYRQLQLRLNDLLGSSGYISVVDILGRGWSDYEETINSQDYAKWQIIQDYRDVCDFLYQGGNVERWTSSPRFTLIQNPYDPSSNLPAYKEFQGDLGIWRAIVTAPANPIDASNEYAEIGIYNETNHSMYLIVRGGVTGGTTFPNARAYLGNVDGLVSSEAVLNSNQKNIQIKHTNNIFSYITSPPFLQMHFNFKRVDVLDGTQRSYCVVFTDTNIVYSIGEGYPTPLYDDSLKFIGTVASHEYGYYVYTDSAYIYPYTTTEVVLNLFDKLRSELGHPITAVYQLQSYTWLQAQAPENNSYIYCSIDDIGCVDNPSFDS